MEPLTFMRAPTPSHDTQSSKKRTSSPDAHTTRTKKPKTEPGQGHSDKDRRRRRRRKQKKQPIARDSGDHNLGAVSGDAQNVPSSSLTPASPLPSASRSTESRLSLASSQSDRPFDSSSAPPPLHSSLGSSSHEQRAACAPLRSERVMPASHSECKSLHDHKTLLASLVSSLVCQICLDLLHKPFALSPCGHVSCYRCLVNWFNVDQQPDGLEGGSVFRKKTCPHCRAVVHGRPVEAWNVKDMSNLGQDFHQSADINFKEAAPTISETPQQDPWQFLPVEGSTDVYRCLDCMHEIWGGLCSQCGRHYSGHDVDASDENASGEEHRARWSILPAMERIMGWPHGNVDESDDGSYESSFIDDDDSERRDSEAVEISSDDDEITTLATGQNRDLEGRVRITFSDGSEDGDEKVSDNSISDESQKKARRTALGTRRQVLSDNDVDDNRGYSTESEDDGSLARPPMRLFGHPCARRSEDERVESELSGSDESNNAGLEDGHSSDDQWFSGGRGRFSAGGMVEESSDDDLD
ncbi:hypothetical protein F5888DRAFT_1679523 [Russula emetica]|nr:hypothetical protein F5888DRAFT_1679523 [Russula emetica]